MNKTFTHNENQKKHFLQGGTFHWKRSEADVWDELKQKLDQNNVARREHTIRLQFFRYVAAAILLVAITMGGLIQFYTKTVTTTLAQHTTVRLPDGSTVRLNAQTALTYKPIGWFLKRETKLNGEAFFEVKKGSRFTVKSNLGQTRVLGTSFNVFARENLYKVLCVTGRVEVMAKDERVIILPNNEATFTPNSTLKVNTNQEALINLGWLNNRFVFTATPINEVFREIERQYGIRLTMKTSIFQLYSGNFNKTENIEEVLGMVCPPLGLTFVKHTNKEYYIIKMN